MITTFTIIFRIFLFVVVGTANFFVFTFDWRLVRIFDLNICWLFDFFGFTERKSNIPIELWSNRFSTLDSSKTRLFLECSAISIFQPAFRRVDSFCWAMATMFADLFASLNWNQNREKANFVFDEFCRFSFRSNYTFFWIKSLGGRAFVAFFVRRFFAWIVRAKPVENEKKIESMKKKTKVFIQKGKPEAAFGFVVPLGIFLFRQLTSFLVDLFSWLKWKFVRI